MGVKEEAKSVISGILGVASADKVDSFSDSDPKAFLDQCKEFLGGMLGPSLAQQKLQDLYDKYA
ncbi:MAG: hypothetical protein ACOCQX_00275 [Candidatus Nanoarchaeia archaeon]